MLGALDIFIINEVYFRKTIIKLSYEIKERIGLQTFIKCRVKHWIFIPHGSLTAPSSKSYTFQNPPSFFKPEAGMFFDIIRSGLHS